MRQGVEGGRGIGTVENVFIVEGTMRSDTYIACGSVSEYQKEGSLFRK